MKVSVLGPVTAKIEDRSVDLGGPRNQLMLAVLLEAKGKRLSKVRRERRGFGSLGW